MRIAFISQFFDPEGGSAAIPGAIVRALQERGHDVEVVTGFPSYPHGRLYDGYRLRPYMRETVRGVTVHRVPLYPSHDRSAVRRILNFVSFMASVSTLGALLSRRAQVALVYSTPGTVGMAGLVLRRLLRRPFVLYIQDVWPDTVTATGMLPQRLNAVAEWTLHRFCNQVYRAAARIAVISPGMKVLLVDRGVPAEKVEIVYNWVDESLFKPVQTEQSLGADFEVMYAGNIGDIQGLDVAIRAVAALGGESRVVLRFVGSGVAQERLARLARDVGVADRVRFEGARDISEMALVMSSADVQLVSLRDDPLFHLTMPSKIQAILSCGLPLITCAPGDAGVLTEWSGAGWSVPAGDVDKLASVFRHVSSLNRDELVEHGRTGRRFYEEHLSAEVGSHALELALSAALDGEGR